MIYAVMILLVYFAQTTAVRLDSLDEQAMKILDYSRGGLYFSYDLLGYGMMALSTFFVGLTIDAKNKADQWLKCLMIIHGIFSINACLKRTKFTVYGVLNMKHKRFYNIFCINALFLLIILCYLLFLNLKHCIFHKKEHYAFQKVLLHCLIFQ